MLLTASPVRRASAGFTYIGLLILVAMMGVTLAAVATIWHTAQQRVKEQQLLFIGQQFSLAINAYAHNTPNGVQQFPKKLEDLLLDKRQPYITRYLRKIYADPFTGNTQWGLIKGADGGIVGVRSLSEVVPLKTDNFPKGYEQFAKKQHYSEWQFVYRGAAIVPVSPVNKAVVAAAVPPEYQVPALPPPVANVPPVNQRKINYCQITFVSDAGTCATMGTKFGSAAGAACMASARARNAVCLGDPNVPMPSLVVQYQ